MKHNEIQFIAYVIRHSRHISRHISGLANQLRPGRMNHTRSGSNQVTPGPYRLEANVSWANQLHAIVFDSVCFE